MAGRCSAPSSLRRETVERLDGRPRHDLILRSPRSGRLEGRSRRRRRARWSVLRDATPAAPLLGTRRQGRTAATLSVTVARKFRLQTLEKVDSAPGIALDPQFSTVATGWNLLRDATLCVAPQHEGGERLSAAAAADNRPEILLQTIEKVDSAPGVSTPPETIGGADAAQPGTRAAALDKVRRDAPPADNRPEIPAQTIEKVDSAPRIAPDPQFSTVAIGWTLLRDATLRVAAQHQGGERPSAAVAAEDRPEILLQTLEKVDSAPGEIEPSRRRRTPSPSLGSRPGDRGKNGRPGRQISGRRSPAGAWAITGGRPWGALCRLSSRYPTTCIVSHIAASAGLCRPSISTLTS